MAEQYKTYQAMKRIPSTMPMRYGIISPRCAYPIADNSITNLTVLHVISERQMGGLQLISISRPSIPDTLCKK